MPYFYVDVFLKIVSSVFFLISGIVWKKLLSTGKKNYHFIFYRTIASVFFLGVLFVCYYNKTELPDIHISDVVTCIGICMFSFWGLYFYTEALQDGRYSFITPLIGISAAISFGTSLLLYNEVITTSKYLALVLIVIGLLIHQKEKLVSFKISKEMLLILLFSMFWGISFVFYLIPIKKFGVINFSLILEVCVLVSCVGLLLRKEKRICPPIPNRNNLGLCLLMGFLVAGGSLLSNFTLTQFPVSLNILLGLLFELVVLTVGFYFFEEKLSGKDWLLIGLATLGGILMLF